MLCGVGDLLIQMSLTIIYVVHMNLRGSKSRKLLVSFFNKNQTLSSIMLVKINRYIVGKGEVVSNHIYEALLKMSYIIIIPLII